MGAERDFSSSFSAGSRGWVLRISLLRQQTPHNCSNRCVSLKYFLKPFAQKIIKEDRIAHGYRAVFDSTRTCLVPWESTSPPSHRQGGKLPYWDSEMAWGGIRRRRKAFFVGHFATHRLSTFGKLNMTAAQRKASWQSSEETAHDYGLCLYLLPIWNKQFTVITFWSKWHLEPLFGTFFPLTKKHPSKSQNNKIILIPLGFLHVIM